MTDRKPSDRRAFGLMVLFCLVLGMQQVALKAAANDVAPILQLAIRSGVAGILVWLYMSVQNERMPLNTGNWKPGLLVGFLFAFEYLFLGFLTWFWLLRHYHASPIGIMSFMTPIFGVVLVSGERWIRQALANPP